MEKFITLTDTSGKKQGISIHEIGIVNALEAGCEIIRRGQFVTGPDQTLNVKEDYDAIMNLISSPSG